ncbi:MAG: DNA-directed RNA polymerase subunit omega, partial [Acidobacteria bacterium]
MKLMDGFDSNYRYILVAARRARQLQGGAPPVIDTHSRKPCRIAQDEIRAGKVKWVIPEMPRPAAEIANELLDKALNKDCFRSPQFPAKEVLHEDCPGHQR